MQNKTIVDEYKKHLDDYVETQELYNNAMDQIIELIHLKTEYKKNYPDRFVQVNFMVTDQVNGRNYTKPELILTNNGSLLGFYHSRLLPLNGASKDEIKKLAKKSGFIMSDSASDDDHIWLFLSPSNKKYRDIIFDRLQPMVEKYLKEAHIPVHLFSRSPKSIQFEIVNPHE